MSQQNIDFGAFPDDPSADAIRTGFQKTQDNFNQLFSAVGTSAVLSVNRTAGVGITVNSPTGNVVVSANIASVRFSSSQLRFGLTPAPTTTTATYTDYTQTMYVELPTNISLGNLTVSGISNLGSASNVIITGGSAGYVLSTNGSGNLSWISPSGGSGLANGTSNVAIPVINGNINLTSNGVTSLTITDTGAVLGNGTGGDLTGGNLISANSLDISATANFVSASNVTLGAVGNIHISGGSSGDVLSTDGTGNLSWAAPALRVVVSAIDYTPVLADAYNTLVRMTKGTATNFILPNDADLDMPIGTAILIGWDGDGEVTVLPDTGVTCDTPDTLTIAKKWGKIVVFKISANYWQVEGNLTPGA